MNNSIKNSKTTLSPKNPVKLFKIIILIALVSGIIYVAFFIPKRINIDGNWSVSTIVLDGKSLTDTKNDTVFHRSLEFFKPKHIAQISRDSLFIQNGGHKIAAKYKIQQGTNGNHLIYFVSNEKALNGAFQITFDTLVTSQSFYNVYVDIVSNSTQLSLQKEVYVKPWKPRPIQRGKPY
jgi:hypothetical protein